jgi:HK97 family phage portal protein
MGIFDRIFRTNEKQLQISERGELPGLATLAYTKHSFTPVTNFAQAYRLWKENPVAQGCTMAYSLTMPEAYLAVRDGESFVYDHPVSVLFAGSSWRLSMATAMTYLCIGGNVYYHKRRNAAGAVIDLKPYSDANFAPVLDEYGNIRAYHYNNGSTTWEIPKDDVVHIRGFWVDPAISYAGGSPIVLASTTIESYNEASGTIFSIHKNDAMPKTLVIYDEEMSPDQVSLAERSFKRKYGGERRGSVGHMWGVKSVERLALDYNELGMESTFSQYEARICGVFRVHPIIAYTYAGIMSSTYSNAEQASKDFTDMVRVPLWNMIADQINEQLAIPDFGVEVGFDLSTVEALKPSVESQRATALQAYQVGVMTLNEAREAFALDAVQGVAQTEVVTASRSQRIERKNLEDEQGIIVDIDDTLVTSSGNPRQSTIDYVNALWDSHRIIIVTGRSADQEDETIAALEEFGVKVDEWHFNDTTAPAIDFKRYKAGLLLEERPIVLAIDNDDDTRDMYEDLGINSEEPPTEGGADDLSAGFRSDSLDDVTYFKAVDDISEKWAKRIAISYGKEVRKLERQILGSVKTHGAVMIKQEGDPFDVEDWTARFLAATEDDRKGLVEEMIAAAASDVDAEDGEYGKARREGIDESSQKIASSIGTIREDVRFILNQSGGLSAEEIAALLRSKFDEISTARANAIGRTTATATTGKTQSAVWKTASDRESDPDRKIVRQWISFPGARDAHSKANGQWENLVTGFFTVGGEETEYPAGPFLSAKNAVNCRCITRARRKIDYDRATQGG